ncbi:response regulator [Pontibacter sp. JAM-7]|uniref:response regulator n=1 Tax=Pontibacter sp. JAM-7 TaxID=3366581 RepID=UPI003AF7EC5B
MKIVIVDDHAVVRQGYTSLLSSMVDNCSVSEAESGEELLSLYPRLLPDLVIMDVGLKSISGIETTKRLLQRFPQSNVLFFSMYDETPLVKKALESGARGYISKNCRPEVLVDAVKKVMSGQFYVEHELAMKLAMNQVAHIDDKLRELTQRELEIFIMLAKGLGSAEVADQLCISSKTVANHTTVIKSKLGVHTIAELVHLALEGGLIRIGNQHH